MLKEEKNKPQKRKNMHVLCYIVIANIIKNGFNNSALIPQLHLPIIIPHIVISSFYDVIDELILQ